MAGMEPYLFEGDEHAELRKQARRFAREHIAPQAAAWEEAEEFPRELYGEAGATGLLGVGYPEAWGGTGGDFGHLLVVAEEFVVAGQSVGTTIGLGSHGIALPPIVRFGTDAQRERFVRPVVAGEKIAALAITEPGCGSDVASLRTQARRDGDHFVVNGAKTFITSGTRADIVTCAVRTGGPQHAGISLLVIERGTPGFSVSRKLKKTGWWASDTAELAFDDVRVPVENRVGSEGSGFHVLMRNFQTERLALAAYGVATAEMALEESVRYSKQRAAFGRPLVGFQVTRHKLAEMATQVTLAKTLVYQVARRMEDGEVCIKEVSIAKNVAAEVAMSVTYQAVQLHGGMGYMRETLVERLSRDARLLPIGGGTQEIMNEIIAKSMGL